MTFERQINFDPLQPIEPFLRDLPAKWVVYLMSDADGRPVQLLCVKNLRYSLKHRLSGEDDATIPSRRVNYREIVRSIAWRRVDSAFEADVVYLEAARAYFPQTYQGMIGMRPAWFLHVDPKAEFPRYTKTTDLSIATGMLLGPLEDKNVAGKLIEDVSDWFDLCRYYHILVEAPRAKACAYKEMGKCPAPCDGSISMPQYRRMIEWSSRAIVNPQELIREHSARMQAAAKELRFESAAKIKAYIDSLSVLGNGELRHVRRLRDFNFLTLQHGPHVGKARVFLVTPGVIEELAGVPFQPARPGDLMRLVLERAADRVIDSVDSIGAERVGVVTHHLFSPRSTHGIFLPLESIDEQAIAKAYRDLLKQKTQAEVDDEGVTKVLQSM